MGKLTGKVAIVTGAGRGIGRAIALAYGEEGASVVVASRSRITVEKVAGEIAERGGVSLGVTVDVGERSRVDAMVEETVAAFGALHILVNNAQGFGTAERPEGSPGYIPLESFPEDVWDHTVQTGLKGTLYGMQAAFPHMRGRGGKILNFGSGNGIAALKGSAAYNSTKEAIRTLSRTAAGEWGKYNICVNTIVPTMATDAATAFFESRPGIEEKLVAQIPLRRMGDPARDIGPLAVFLASSDSDFITGQTINVDGGQISRP
ncbi:SDR family oxidoreductase [Acidiferrimicrobium sp. IK]|uniref:SDR family NAD(P)-dependent oxidoreductase n=1 Tax=Acidiferrimicrobium sp. IK TaxID=2871700 RepID=UPI0021CB4560|nr:SDR family oxidoreductase [Acidiferrimicrobium sp. IK]MCU4186792.1 SDR family oxidoreductase [Acidiferrimicrobium sp. IK]